MNYPKVSVVVPIYKVEKFLNRCIKSILNQTYKNLEVILINDGSPDRCGEIVEGYARIDKRVKVVHKDNGGLSEARNTGMEKVTGEFTVFVDSDDWLDSKMVEELINTSQRFQADIVQSAFYYAHDDYLLFDQRVYSIQGAPVVLDRHSLMHELVRNERVKNFAWGKLYKTELIKDIPFKKGVLFEDVFWAHQVMHRVDVFVLINNPLYYYFQRSDSIVATYSKRNLDILVGLKERHEFIKINYPQIINESYREILKASLIHYNLLLLNRKRDKNGQLKKEIKSYISENYMQLKNAIITDKTLEKQLFLFKIGPNVNFLFLVLRKILIKLNFVSKSVGLKRINL